MGIAQRLRPPRIFAFADYERDAWVAEQARSLPSDARILDVGAGPCRYRPLFAHCRYESQDFAQYTGSRQGSFTDHDVWRYGTIDYVSDASNIPVETGSFDAVLCTEVLEHVPNPVAVVHELARVLKPGGRLMLTAPLGSGLHQEPFHFYGGYTPYWYARYLGEAGFTDIHAEPNGGFFKHYGQESQRLSAMIDPRRWRTAQPLTALFWALTLPWFRVIVPLLCHYLDRGDEHRGYTVGYHVLARRAATASVCPGR